MAIAQDIKISDETDDLLINDSTGDFEARASDTRHVEDIIASFVGWWKEYPTVGVGIRNYSGASSGIQEATRKVKLQLEADGYRVDDIEVRGQQIYVTGERRNNGNL